MTLTVGSLFSGIGGLDLGLERAGMKIVWQVEKDEYSRKVLGKHWLGVPCYHDVKDISGIDTTERPILVPRVDVLCGGFPCQPFSTASRGRRVAEDLWPEMHRLVRDLRPRFVIAENASLKAIERAGRDLAGEGYACGIVDAPAAVVGASHERPRYFLVADANSNGQPLCAEHAQMACISPLAGSEAWADFPDRLGVDDGVPSRMDRLRCLGNAVVPQIAELVGRLVMRAANIQGAAQ